MRCISLAIGCLGALPHLASGQPLTLEWRGHDADRVTRQETAGPDSITDLHLRLHVHLDQPGTIQSIVLRLVDAGGGPVDDFGYGTADATGPLLVVERAGERVNEGFGTPLFDADRESTLDLYANDFGTIDTGTRVEAEVALDGGRALRRTFTLTPPDGRLLGLWNIHCNPRSPEAFEPMTLSGRLWLDLAADGAVTGEINGVPLGGTMHADSLHAAGESGLGRATVDGTVVRRGARRHAEGGVDYQPAGEQCSGGRWWTE